MIARGLIDALKQFCMAQITELKSEGATSPLHFAVVIAFSLIRFNTDVIKF